MLRSIDDANENSVLITIPELDATPELETSHAKLCKALRYCDTSSKNLKLSGAELLTTAIYASATTPFFEQKNDWKNYMGHPFTLASIMLCNNLLTRHKSKVDLLPWRALLFSLFALFTQNALIHEGGHAGTSLLFWKSKPEITIYPFGSGVTKIFHPDDYTNLGLELGKNTTDILVTVAGTSAAMLWNYGSLIAAQAIPNEEIKTYLRFCVLQSLVAHLYYTIMAVINCNPDAPSDFCDLEEHGYSPWLFAGLMVGSLLFLQLCLSGISYCFTNENKNREDDKALLNIQDLPEAEPRVEEIQAESEILDEQIVRTSKRI